MQRPPAYGRMAGGTQTTSSGNSLPPAPFLGLWKQEWCSNIRIRLVKQSHAEDGHEDSIPGEQVWADIPCHDLVLKQGSTYFKGLLETGSEMRGDTTCSSPNCNGSTRSTDDGEQRHICRQCSKDLTTSIDVPCTLEEASAFENVIEFLYTHSLPPTIDGETLLKIVMSADYLGAELCLQGCASLMAVATTTDFQLLQYPSLYNILQRNLPSASSILDQVQINCFTALTARLADGQPTILDKQESQTITEILLLFFADARQLLTNETMRQRFCSLPLAAVLLWGASDELKVESENDVAIVLSQWWGTQPISQHTQDVKLALSSQLRLPLLTTSFLTFVLEGLPFWQRPPELHANYKYACSLLQTAVPDTYHTNRDPFRGLVTTKRLACKTETVQLDWDISLEELQACVDFPYRILKGPQIYSNGFDWQIQLCWYPADDFQELPQGLSIRVMVQPAVKTFKGESLCASAAITLISALESRDIQHVFSYPSPNSSATSKCCGTHTAFDTTDMREALQGLLQEDGCLHVHAIICDVH